MCVNIIKIKKINNINLISFKLKGDQNNTYQNILSNIFYQPIYNNFTNYLNHFGCYVNGITYNDINNNNGLIINNSGIYNIELNINWVLRNNAIINKSSFYISLVVFNAPGFSDPSYNKDTIADIHERLAFNKLGPFSSDNIFYFSDTQSSNIIQKISENVFLKQNTLITPYIKLENIDNPNANNLNIGINYSKSSWGVTQIN